MDNERVLDKIPIKYIMILVVLGIALSGCIGTVKNSKDENPLDVNIPIKQNTPTPSHTPSPTPRNSINIRTSAIWTTRAPWDPSFPYGEYGGKVNVGVRTGDAIGSVAKYGEPAYLIVTFEISNNGYKEINTNPANFYIVYNRAKYGAIKGSYYLKDVLSDADLLNGGIVKGSLAYSITYEGDKNYEVIYDDGINEYNVDHTFKSQ